MLENLVRHARVAVLCVASVAPFGLALAQAQPIRIVVGYPPGGTADAVARAYAEKLRTVLGTNVMVENQAGAGGQIAAQNFLAAPRDNTTFLLANNHMMTTLPLTVPSVTYDPVKDFQPIGRMASFEHVLVAGPSLKVDSLADYLKAARANQKDRLYGIPAPGSAPHFIGYTVGKQNGIALEPVAYKGGAPLLSDLLGGHVPAAVDALGSLTQYHENGRLKILATTGETRLKTLPNVPTFSELGYPGLQASGWVGLFTKPGADPALVGRMNDAIAKVAAMPEIQATLEPMGFRPETSTPEAMRQTIADELAHWGPIVKESGYQAQ